MMFIAAAAFTLASLTTHTDTTVSVRPGTLLDISNFGGSVAVSTWNKNAVRIEADHSTRTDVDLDVNEGAFKISTSSRRGPPGSVDFEITMPMWMAVSVTGPFTDVQIDGAKSGIRVETVKGEVQVVGGAGPITLSSVQGGVVLQKASGRIKVSSINEGITLDDVVGNISAETVNGDVTLSHIDSDEIDASSVSGDLAFLGALKHGGQYHFQTHSGDIQVIVPDKTNAAVTVSTFNGDFDSNCDIKLNQMKGHRNFAFTLGGGGSDLQLESFSGDILLHKGTEMVNLRDLPEVKTSFKRHTLERIRTVEREKRHKARDNQSDEDKSDDEEK
jgi:hypothetical protein